MILEDFPPELIEFILTFLPASSIMRLGHCSRKMRAITIKEHVWRQCAQRDYSVDLRRNRLDDEESECTSARKFYHKILLPFGSSLRPVWNLFNFCSYGGLAKLLYHQWSLYLVFFDPPTHPHHQQKRKVGRFGDFGFLHFGF